MSNEFTKHLLSGSTDGKPILLTQTFGPGILIHTSESGQTNFDEPYIYANNTSGGKVLVTLQWGGILEPNHSWVEWVEAYKTHLITPGLLIQNSLIIRAFADTINVITVNGWVNRITVT